MYSISSRYLFCNWKLVPLNCLYLFCPFPQSLLWQLPVCFLCLWVCLLCLFIYFLLWIPHISDNIQYLSFSNLVHLVWWPGGSVVKNLPASEGDTRLGFGPWVRKIPWRRKRQPTPVFLLGNPMDRCAWWVPVHGVAKSQTWLSNWAHMQSHRREGLGIGGGRVNKHKSLHLLLLRGRHSINISIFISTNLPG